MPKTAGGKKIYSDREKAAYYKRKAAGNAMVPRQKMISGQGDYRTYFSKVRGNMAKPYRYPGLGRKLGSAAGGVIGNYAAPGVGAAAGSLLGGALGNAAHYGIKAITGLGDYNISKNSMLFNQDAVPQFSGNARCTVVSHREFISDIQSSIGFNANTFIINPGNANTFPWLSQIAQNYEEYVVQGIIFEYKTTSSASISSGSNLAMGTVVMCTQYNSLDATFNNKQQMENYEFAQSTVPSISCIHAIECDPALTANQGLFYVNQGSQAQVNADPRLYNIGKFTIATVGMQSTSVIGELWVSYKICFLKPRLSSSLTLADRWALDAPNVQPNEPFGVTPALSASSTSFQVTAATQAFTSLLVNPWNASQNQLYGIYINPNYTGNIIVVFQTHGGVVSGQDPQFALQGNIISTTVFAPHLPFGSYQKSYGAAVGDQEYTFLCTVSGGYDSSGHTPAIYLQNGTFTATAANLVVYAVTTNLIN